MESKHGAASRDIDTDHKSTQVNVVLPSTDETTLPRDHSFYFATSICSGVLLPSGRLGMSTDATTRKQFQTALEVFYRQGIPDFLHAHHHQQQQQSQNVAYHAFEMPDPDQSMVRKVQDCLDYVLGLFSVRNIREVGTSVAKGLVGGKNHIQEQMKTLENENKQLTKAYAELKKQYKAKSPRSATAEHTVSAVDRYMRLATLWRACLANPSDQKDIVPEIGAVRKIFEDMKKHNKIVGLQYEANSPFAEFFFEHERLTRDLLSQRHSVDLEPLSREVVFRGVHNDAICWELSNRGLNKEILALVPSEKLDVSMGVLSPYAMKHAMTWLMQQPAFVAQLPPLQGPFRFLSENVEFVPAGTIPSLYKMTATSMSRCGMAQAWELIATENAEALSKQASAADWAKTV